MAEAITRAELAALGYDGDWRVASAGVSVPRPGGPIAPLAVKALRQLDIPVPRHESRPLTPELIAQAHTIYCMTPGHRQAVLAMVPDAADRTVVLDPDDDLPDPHGQPLSAYRDCADMLRAVIGRRLAEASSPLMTVP
jgi:protein-tyrosine-phosphatase